MLTDGDEAPAFAAPAALPDGDVETVPLDDALASGPAVLTFFSGAFTGVRSGEMRPFAIDSRSSGRPARPSTASAPTCRLRSGRSPTNMI